MEVLKGDRSLEHLIELLTDPATELRGRNRVIIEREGKPPIVLTALGLTQSECENGHGSRFLLSFAPIGVLPRPDQSLLSKLFGLTAAEARLASMLATGMSTDQAAAELDIARETVRSHLKPIFAKTGTHRQSQLVALLANL
ncbi:helix-turn-helix transcriptional regulator [Methyloceanibacter caenitepidi]|uniref:Transcriptional regulator, LuxR family n=1 Tax=Methyloceanibacter caenitepidi TaxID=1384459 RepID=A0A0A8K1C7_9HYPH|nr:helix-turn-helix transcriptional regulator [Methyloceanibacter caenitepidi]BAQ16725.1 transcriptional regulator, LuxR family [Methyloceanibacter caenitepidi]